MNRCQSRRIGVLGVLAASALASAACEVTIGAGNGPYSVREERRFTVTGTPNLSITTFDGAIEVRSWDKSEVLVEIEKRAVDKVAAEAIDVRVEQAGDRVTIEVRKPSGAQPVFGFRPPSARVVASVPRQCNLSARSGDGSITIGRITGKVELNTGDGTVRGTEIVGSLRAHTGDGTLRFDDMDGTVDIESGDGGARVNGKLQAVRIRTGDGGVEVRAEDGSAMTEEWEIRTGDGTMRVELPGGFAADLDAATGDGTVRVRGFGEPTGVRGEDGDRRELRRPIGNGGKTLRLRADSGSISVRSL